MEASETVNSLMLGVALRAGKPPYHTSPYCAAVYSGRTIVAAALMTPPFHVQITGEGADDREVLELIARSMGESGQAAPGVMARDSIAATFAEIYSSLYGTEIADSTRMRLYQLEKLIPPQWPSGTFRVATEADTDLLTAWSEEFGREALPNDPVRSMRAITAHKVGEKELFIWEDGQPVSMASKSRPTRNSSTISLVYTPPEFRARGYAGACTAALSQYLLDSGYRHCVLFTDLANPTSNSIYQRIGYRPVCDFTSYRFGSIAQ